MADSDLIGSAGLYKAMRSAFGGSIEKPKAAFLGFLDANGVPQLVINDPSPDRFGKYYYTEAYGENDPAESTSFGEAYNGGPTILPPEYLTFGRPIYVARDPESNEWYIHGLRPRPAAQYGGGTPPEPTQLGSINMKTGLLDVTQPNSMRAVVYGATYTLNHSFKVIDSLPTDDFTAAIPATAGQALYVGVYLDWNTAALVYRNGDEFDNALQFAQVWAADDGSGLLLPQGDSDQFRVGFIRLANGMTAITRAMIVALQEIFVKVDYSDILVDPDSGDVVTADGFVLWA